ncbi:hypothetical protein D9V29_12345 [Mycetocola manganoxydans]|uniref:Uncharacterized protein n=1 Tax=Mycetocola manganoxydans TaxID=699879 RepID=A0A3L6ZPR2_9MICO|nr:hypothetical protein D9V29_12345 [Mycetocola manganoxydans]
MFQARQVHGDWASQTAGKTFQVPELEQVHFDVRTVYEAPRLVQHLESAQLNVCNLVQFLDNGLGALFFYVCSVQKVRYP